MTVAERFAMMTDAWKNGKTVYVVTPLRATKITPSLAAKWDAVGRPVVKVSRDGRSLLMAQGKRYVCITWTTIQIGE